MTRDAEREAGVDWPRSFGPFELLAELGRGGSGQVFLGRRKADADRTLLAVKRFDAAEARRLGLFGAARRAARLDHPDIARVEDLGEVGTDGYVALGYVEGHDLRALMNHAHARGVGLPWAASLSLVADTARALDHAHRTRDFDGTPLELVHGDVSPQNLVVRPEGRVAVIDFGLGEPVGGPNPIRPRGKWAYAAPEVLERPPGDARADQWALGVVLYELTTGRRPFGERPASGRPAPRPGALVPGYPAELEAVVLTCLRPEPERRFPSLGAVAERLEALLSEARVERPRGAVRALYASLFGEAPAR